MGQRLSREQRRGPALHQRAADPERCGYGPALRRDGLHLDHGLPHGRRLCPVRALPRASRVRDGGHPCLRRPGPHASRGDDRRVSGEARARVRYPARRAAPIRRGDEGQARHRGRGRRRPAHGRRRKRHRHHLGPDSPPSGAHRPGGMAAAGRLRQRGGFRQLLVAGRAGRVRPRDDRRPRAVPVPTVAPGTSSRLRIPTPTSANWWRGSSRGAATRRN